MASVSLPASLAIPSPFDSSSPQASPKAHKRRPSRNPNAAPLPVFSFNPGANENLDAPGSLEAKDQDESTIVSNDAPVCKAARPLPLPNFSFNPGASLPSEERPPSPTHPVLQEMAMNQQRVSRSARPAPLAAFTFPPGSASAQRPPSPVKLASDDSVPSSRNGMGHRRRGSEFVGGGNEANQMLSGSPEKPEYRPQGPPISGISRGHAHRRSQAVSISDIETSDLIKANAVAKARAGSTPTTPSEITQQFPFARASPARQSISYSARSPPSSPRRRGSAPGVRPRVGFADHVDVIPRPLSLISSETEGSSSTVRGGHSLSGSINSIASPTPRPSSIVSLPVSAEPSPERPHTADPATLLSIDYSQTDRAMSIISLPKRPLSASGSPGFTGSGSPPNKKKHFWFSNSNNASPTPTPKAEVPDPLATLTDITPAQAPESPRPRTSPERAVSVKKRKYHTWTSGIFSRKSGKRSSKLKPKRTPTPPTLQRRTSDHLNEMFDADETVVIREPSPVAQRQRAPQPRQRTPPRPSWDFEEPSNPVTSPMIDLDAALGPFGSEEKLGNESCQKNASSRLAKLHSSERRSGMDAFGTVHRRTESAPSMQAINRSTFGMHRLGSNTSLVEDVFDEEEEDNFLAEENANSGDDSKMEESQMDNVKDDGHVEAAPETPRSRSVDGLGLSLESPSDGIIIVDTDEDPVEGDPRSSKSTIEAPIFPPEDMPKRPTSSPMDFAYPAPQSYYASSTEGRTTSASMLSSPDPDHVTFDNPPRTNRNLEEPGPEFVLRASNDDLPSLSDSISSGAVPRMSSGANTRSSVEQRSASVAAPSSAKPNQGWKRSSVASLNRLLPGSSNGSKLKFETVQDATADEKSRKKTNRISKLMHFWRSKEKGEN